MTTFLYLAIAVSGCGMSGTFENTIGIEFMLIKPGSFLMGGENGDFDEVPVHRATISKPFLMAKTEVTNAQYEQFDLSHRNFRGKFGISSDNNEPAVNVSWYDAVRFCEWLSEKEKKPYRLPTEAEWEYACRAGMTTAYAFGDSLPAECHHHQQENWGFEPVDLTVALTAPNQWGLHDMHGGVEEWCLDWYGSYEASDQTDPVRRIDGDFKVTRGGSHNTTPFYLRSANRMGTLPEDRHPLIGFRVVIGEMSDTVPLSAPEQRKWAQDVNRKPYDWLQGSSPDTPYFEGPIRFVNIPEGSNGPLFSQHNHCPALTACPNGDILAVWYTTNNESGRELAIAASRFRLDSDVWDPPSPFWDVPDRNDHASDLLWDGDNTIYHFNGLSSDATWGKLALIMRSSTDSGATWSKARLIMPKHGLRHMPVAGVFRTKEGYIVQPSDAVTGGHGGTAVLISRDEGKTWYDPGEGKPAPDFSEGATGAWIAGIHAGVVQLKDGSLLAFGRGDDIDGRMPMSISNDIGETWTYHASEFPPINGGQRLVLMRLREGPILFVSFTDTSAKRKHKNWPSVDGIVVRDAAGKIRRVYGMYAALSFDNGSSWQVRKPITPGGWKRELDGGAWTDEFIIDDEHSEPMGYLAATQAPDGVIHLISSALHYRFNLAWLLKPMPVETSAR